MFACFHRDLCQWVAAALGCAAVFFPAHPLAETFEVEVRSNNFKPSALTVQVGDTVRWVVREGLHTSTSGSACSSNGRWDSGTLSGGSVFSHSRTFTTAGTYPYFCDFHCSLGMVGTVTVTDGAIPSPSPSASPTPAPSPAACLESNPVNANPIPAAIGKDVRVAVSLQELVGTGQGLVSPNGGSAPPGDKRHLYVTDTVGKLWAVDVADGTKNVVLDVSARLVADLGSVSPAAPGYDERGLLGLAFHPKFRRNGLLYLLSSEPYNPSVLADFFLGKLQPGFAPNHRSVVSEWRVDDPRAARPVISGGPRVLMSVDQPQFNHNAGAMAFGPDGFLYIALGDGGSANDRDSIGGHDPVVGNGQDRSTVLGKILRIDPRRRTSANGQYGIPRSNPFAKSGSRGGNAGCGDGMCDEIWAYGFRNPYRFSFDGANLLAGDVGQNRIEEVDWVKKGGNYGWRHKEGSFFFQLGGSGSSFVTTDNCLGVPIAGLIDPLAQYDHDEGIAIVGGYVYRGKAIPALRGRYVFGDYSRGSAMPDGGGRIFKIPAGRLRGKNPPQRTITELNIPASLSGLALYGFGRDARGELYVLGNTSGVPAPRDASGNYLETGVIRKLVPGPR